MTPIQQLMLGVGAKKKTYLDDVFSTFLYTGDSTQNPQVRNNGIDLAGEGGLVWAKRRNGGHEHGLYDTVRGIKKRLSTDSSSAQETANNGVQSFTSTGFTTKAEDDIGGNGDTYASWTFRKAPGFCDVVTWTGDGSSSGRQIAHSLRSVPGMVLIKCTSMGLDWRVYHRSLGATESLKLNSTAAKEDNDTIFADTNPTSTHFTVGGSSNTNSGSQTYVAYVFAGGEDQTTATARSVDFDGSGDYLSTSTSSDLSMGTGDFTVEGWFKINSGSNFGLFMNNTSGLSSTYGVTVYYYTDDGLSFLASNSGITSNLHPPSGQWFHVALVRNGGITSLYYNGLLIKSASDNTNYTGEKFVIAGYHSTSYLLNGSVSNFRVVKGTAVYTSSFRPPTKPLTNITNTKLLCCNNSSTTGSTVTPGTITANGNPTASTDSPFDDPAGFVFGESGSENVIKCGSYVGNGSATGPEIFLGNGWEPQWVLTKNADISDDWYIFDNMRGIVTGSYDLRLRPNSNGIESSGVDKLDLTPTGFKVKSDNADMNGNGNTIIYMALRRPDGYVGKPPELGTSVFNMIAGTSSANPTFVSGFPVDFAFQRKPAQTQDWYTGIRLTGDKNMRLNQNQAEENSASSSSWRWDYQNGWHEYSSSQTANQSWMWKRGHGLDISLYVGTGSSSNPAVIRHGLGKKPEMVWFKKRNESDPWIVYHHGLLGGVNPETAYSKLNYTQAQSSGQSGYAYDSTAVTLTSTWDQVNDANINHLCVLFCSVDGISKCGYYTGSGSSRTITVGFQPRFIILKNTSRANGWITFDTVRGWGEGADVYDTDAYMWLNDSAAQVTGGFNVGGPTSTGFFLHAGDISNNQTGDNYIYYCHA